MLADTAVILAGGKSSRMGFDKQCIKINGRLLIEQQILELQNIFNEIIIVTNKPKLYESYNCILAMDELEDFGPLGGMHAGLMAAKSEFCYFLACDMPNINQSYILHMLSIINRCDFNKQAIITCFGNWLEPFNAFYSKSLLPVIEQAYNANNMKIGSVLANAHTYYIEEIQARSFSPNWSMFANINTQRDLEKLK